MSGSGPSAAPCPPLFAGSQRQGTQAMPFATHQRQWCHHARPMCTPVPLSLDPSRAVLHEAHDALRQCLLQLAEGLLRHRECCGRMGPRHRGCCGCSGGRQVRQPQRRRFALWRHDQRLQRRPPPNNSGIWRGLRLEPEWLTCLCCIYLFTARCCVCGSCSLLSCAGLLLIVLIC